MSGQCENQKYKLDRLTNKTTELGIEKPITKQSDKY